MSKKSLPDAPVAADSSVESSEADIRWMQHALELARQADIEHGEVPVGAVVVRDGELIGAASNANIRLHDPSAHAEILALRAAGQHAGNYRLPGSTLYVTLEPCVMCAGAIIHARIARVVYAAVDSKSGAAGSVFDTLISDRHNHRPSVVGNVLAEDSAEMLKAFFRARR
ncbi:MAG: tRNA adenosine(34) deaminase TadA [Dokdonella sp.]